MIGRRRMRQASMAASAKVMPCSYCALANSTIRIALRADRPMVVSRPTLKNTSLDSPRSSVNSSAPMIPSGTTSITENGIDQLSYSAARQRNTTMAEITNNAVVCEPARRSS